MFIAHTKSGKRINLLDDWSKPQLLMLQEEFVCPVCGGALQLRLGEQKRFHFAHRRETVCTTYFEPESAYHRHGKQQLYHWLREHGFSVEVEVYLPDIRQRPDLLLTLETGRLAIEYQCADIPVEQLQKRTRSYWRAGIRVVWIFGGKRMKRHAAYWARIPPLQALCVQFSSHPYLLYFCPEARAFFKCTPLIPFSTSASFCQQFFYPLKEITPPALFAPETLSLSRLHSEWNKKKKQYRHNALYPYRKSKDRFLYVLYESRIPLSCFPPEICVPLPSGLAFREPALLWQFRLWSAMFGNAPDGACVRLTERVLSRLPRRQLPYFPAAYPKQAAQEYMAFLCRTGALLEEEHGVYRKQRDLFVPQSEEEACGYDEQWLPAALSLFGDEQIVTSRSGKRI